MSAPGFHLASSVREASISKGVVATTLSIEAPWIEAPYMMPPNTPDVIGV